MCIKLKIGLDSHLHYFVKIISDRYAPIRFTSKLQTKCESNFHILFTNLESNSAAIVTNVNAVPKDNLGKFTTSNFTETIVVNSDSVFGNDGKSTNQSTGNMPSVKKRKLDASKSMSSDDINK